MSVSKDNLYHRKDLTGKVALVTGSTDGIGKHTALLLAKSNALVLLHGRNIDRLERSKNDILTKYPSALLETYCYDLETIEETIKFCNDIKSKHANLDILINNAGVFESKRKITKDNLEKTFAINVVAAYIICCSLYSVLNRTKDSRILNVSSISQSDVGFIDLDNLQFEKGGYSSYNSYSLSKLCIAAITYELSLRISPNDVLVMSCDPGTVNTKMLIAGWGMCGIDIEQANDEYHLVSNTFQLNHNHNLCGNIEDFNVSNDKNLNNIAMNIHGKYFVNLKVTNCCSDVYNNHKRIGLWNKLEDLTGIKLNI